MKTIEINLYEFNELSEEAKQKAIEKLCEINVYHDWWECVYDEAKELGFKITGFDIDRGSYCNIKIISSLPEIAENIKEQHGHECETYKNACAFLENLNDLTSKYEEINDVPEELIEEIEEAYEKDLENDYLTILRDEYEYQTSEEAIIQTIEANEYEFTEDGKRY